MHLPTTDLGKTQAIRILTKRLPAPRLYSRCPPSSVPATVAFLFLNPISSWGPRGLIFVVPCPGSQLLCHLLPKATGHLQHSCLSHHLTFMHLAQVAYILSLEQGQGQGLCLSVLVSIWVYKKFQLSHVQTQSLNFSLLTITTSLQPARLIVLPSLLMATPSFQ